MRRISNFFKRYRWALLSGVLVGTSYVPFPPWAIFLCWAPLWWDLVVNTENTREAFLKAWWSQFTLTLIGFHWIAFVAHEFGFLPWWVAIPILLVFSAAMHLYIPLAAALTLFLKRKFSLKPGHLLILLPSFHCLGEIFWPSVFEWNLGYTLFWAKLPWAQWADTIGILGLSYALHLLSALVVWLILKRSVTASALTSAVLLVFLGLFGWLGNAKQKFWAQAPDSLKVLLVQANIGNLEKIYAERGIGYQREIISRYFDLAKTGLSEGGPVDLMIWPESAIPEFLDNHNRERKYSALFFNELSVIKTPLFTGAYSNDPPDHKPRNDYNAAFLFDATGKLVSEPYHKTNLLMFGEYVPLGDMFPILRRWNPGGEGFGRGSGPKIIPFGNYKIGAQICYESLSPNFAAELSKNGADFLINLTNDSWFGPRSEPEQHMIMTLARAIETRRPLLRSTNTGISTAVTASGQILQQSPKTEAWTGTFELGIKKNAELTFYTRWGGLLPLILLIVIALTIWRGRHGTFRLARNYQSHQDNGNKRDGPS